jgi:predicted kinase
MLLLTGIPASGKSMFARYLSNTHGYFAYVLEELPADDEIRKLWLRCLEAGDATRFVKKMRNLPTSVVVEWGFPANEACIRLVQSMKDHGMRVVWFELPDDFARERFVARGTVQVEAFDAQVPAIRANYDTIMERVEPEVVSVLEADGMAKSHDAVFAEING